MRGKWLPLLALITAVRAEACTVCHSDTAVAARRLIFADTFGFNVAISVLPFLTVGVLAAALYRGGARG